MGVELSNSENHTRSHHRRRIWPSWAAQNSRRERKGQVDDKAGVLKEKVSNIKIIIKVLGKTDKNLNVSKK